MCGYRSGERTAHSNDSERIIIYKCALRPWTVRIEVKEPQLLSALV